MKASRAVAGKSYAGVQSVSEEVAARIGRLTGASVTSADTRLPDPIHTPMEFGPDFRGVQVHADTSTDRMKRSLQDSGSILSKGNTMQRGHHVYFLNAISRMTGKSWTIE